jgi:hypothetical protein
MSWRRRKVVRKMSVKQDPKSERFPARLYLRSRMPRNTKISYQYWSTGYMRDIGILWSKQSKKMRDDMRFYNKRLKKSREENGMREY